MDFVDNGKYIEEMHRRETALFRKEVAGCLFVAAVVVIAVVLLRLWLPVGLVFLGIVFSWIAVRVGAL